MGNKLDNKNGYFAVDESVRYAAHSLEMEGFNVSENDISLIENVLNGKISEQQFNQAVQNIINV